MSRFKFSPSTQKSGIGQLAIETEDGDEDYEGFIAIFSFRLHSSDPRKNFGDSAEKTKIIEGEAKNRGGGRRIIESSHELGKMGKAGRRENRTRGKESGRGWQKPGRGEQPEQDGSTSVGPK
jgi:hypothetical protein